nr:hypothetical protein [Thermoproteus uzoniensis]
MGLSIRRTSGWNANALARQSLCWCLAERAAGEPSLSLTSSQSYARSKA